MTLDALIQQLPDYAKDLKLNYSTLIGQNTELTLSQLWGSVLVSAMAARQPALTQAVLLGCGRATSRSNCRGR